MGEQTQCQNIKIKRFDFFFQIILTCCDKTQNKEISGTSCTESRVAHSYSNEGLISYDDFFRGNLTVC